MITGAVSEDIEAAINLTERGPSGQTRRIRAVIDTGFSGSLTLRPALVAELGLIWQETGIAVLADGRETEFGLFVAEVIWDRRRRTILVDEATTTPLVGTALLEGYRLNADFRAGGTVVIQSLRRRQSGS